MNYGLNISASGVLTSMYRQDVLANNLANIDTPGFKPDSPFATQRDPARIEDGLLALPSNQLLERLGAGTLLAPNRTSQRQGDLQQTGNPLDVALKGKGFFVVEAPGQGTGDATERVRLTRDGRFTLNANGRLVTSASGLAVMDSRSRPIAIDRTAGVVSINQDGAITQNGVEVARLQVVDVPDSPSLKKVGDNLYQPNASQMAAMTAADAEVMGGAIERSAVDPIRAMMGVTSAAGGVSGNARMMQLHDELMARAINGFAKVT